MLYPRTLTIIVTAITLLININTSIAGNFKDSPGYMDLEWISIPADAVEIRDIDLSTMLVSVAANAQDKGYGEIAEALAMIKSIRVKSFSITADDTKKTEKAVEKISRKLKSDDWDRLIYVKDEGETVTVSTRNNKDGKMVGLLLVVFEPENEVTFANIVGELDIATLFHLVSMMDSEEFDEVIDEFNIDGDL